ncbi:hypothetical protein [Novosphingobium mangrovi (ex Huang et al. 2023)]|uniref:DUF1109 domain-containing protein n=1 Tax=Novosphingobium mangrovi (ex Huang et al. 2023) TaxID=2976432 RepID=A0ABT2I529_9SPHN|nr:hypothetical protein [Novosphingobium mangrovi (ex Huang et al. 2023)]MCT2399917.1 hypothetical protein [Novosphingobium mangrovi (ex Huang et al. 2023)]
MSDVQQAIAQIADIRAQLAASTRFRGYAPEAVGMIGLLSLLVVVMQIVWPGRFAASDWQIAITWGLLLAGGCAAIAIEAIVHTLRENDGMASPMLFSAMRLVLPAFAVSAAVGGAVLTYAPQVTWILPGFWQMMIGFVAFASYSSLPRNIIWPAAWCLLSGAVGLFLAGHHGSLTPLMAGGPIVVGHLAIAWVISDKERIPHGG